MSKLTWEWGDRDDQIIIRKNKGLLTVDEIMKFLREREQILAFGEGTLCVIAFRLNTDMYSGWEFGKHDGDSQDVWILGDESKCFCGRVLHPNYCPECGHKLWEE